MRKAPRYARVKMSILPDWAVERVSPMAQDDTNFRLAALSCPYTTDFRMRSALSESIVRCKFICDICATRADGRKRLISA